VVGIQSREGRIVVRRVCGSYLSLIYDIGGSQKRHISDRRPKAEGGLDNDNDKKFLVQHCMMHTLGLTAPTGNLKHVNPGRIGTA
jgi:hypothetical protein